MGHKADDTSHQSTNRAELGLTPDQRLDAIADILVRGLARLILAEDNAGRTDSGREAQAPEITSEVALLNGDGDALMVERGQARAHQGGRRR